MNMNKYLDVAPEVKEALEAGKPVVALESTIISHGMPYPQNVETALKVEAIIRENGAVPATIAVLGGRLKAGLSPEEIDYLGKTGAGVAKASRRDLPILVAQGRDGATTVTTTMIIAHMAGIQVFATGGIGGVHRGAETTMEAVDELRVRCKDRGIKDTEGARQCMREILAEYLDLGGAYVDMSRKPAVILFIGVNGVGKTTSIGKLAAHWKRVGRKVVLCAGDTFRAAAAEQLTIWADRAGVDIVKQHEGADPAAVVYDALSAAKARKADVVLVDTAGRLQNKANLMNELNKISRVIDRECPDSSRETLLVLDATTGQNGLIQAKEFSKTAGVSGIVLTKLDGTAKGGIVIAIAKELGVPVKFAGVGEGVDDLQPFDPEEFTQALL